MTLKQIWCGITMGHDFLGLPLLNENDPLVVGLCTDCGLHIYVKADTPLAQVRAWTRRQNSIIQKVNEGDCAPLPENAGTMRYDLGTVLVKSATFDHKAHAATRKRGPNGQFLPAFYCDGKNAKKQKDLRKRKRNGQFSKGKRK